MTEPSHAQLLERIGRLDATVEALKEDIAEIKADIKPLREAATMGRGMLLAILKVGTVAAAFIGAAAWVFDKFHK